MKDFSTNRVNANRWHFCLTVTAIFLVTPFSQAFAQADDFTKYGISVGIFITDRDSKTRFDAQANPASGTIVDLETELGLDSSDSVFRLDGYFRFNQKHRLDFSWFDLSRTASTPIQRDIDWNDTMFAINTVIDSDFDLSIYKAAYTWSFLQRDKGYLGLTAGLYVADIQTTLSAPSIAASEVGSVTAPLPVFGLRGEYYFSDKWTFRASGEIFVFEYEDFDGSLYDIYAGLDYQLFDRMAVGFGINSVRMDIGVTKVNATGNIDWRYDGGLLFLKFDF